MNILLGYSELDCSVLQEMGSEPHSLMDSRGGQVSCSEQLVQCKQVMGDWI
jgi:hypothetical protein